MSGECPAKSKCSGCRKSDEVVCAHCKRLLGKVVNLRYEGDKYLLLLDTIGNKAYCFCNRGCLKEWVLTDECLCGKESTCHKKGTCKKEG